MDAATLALSEMLLSLGCRKMHALHALLEINAQQCRLRNSLQGRRENDQKPSENKIHTSLPRGSDGPYGLAASRAQPPSVPRAWSIKEKEPHSPTSARATAHAFSWRALTPRKSPV
jgi:hypothetical protein